MEISKIKALWKLLTGGWAGLAEYILEAVNAWLAKLDKPKLAEASKIVRAISSALVVLLETFLPARYKAAGRATVIELDTLAAAMEDGELTKAELNENIDAIEAAIKAWKEVF